MQCERCKKKKAVVFYRENSGGRIRALHVCDECAEVLESAGELEDISAAMAGYASPFSTASECATILPLTESALGSAARTAKCPLCGTTLRELAATGQAGCARCYEVFSDALDSVVNAVYGRNMHIGRTSAGERARQEQAERLAGLKRELELAVASEHFEVAVGLRDEIRALKAAVECAGKED